MQILQARLHDWRSLEKHITEGCCPRVKEMVAQGLDEEAMLRTVRDAEQLAPPEAPVKATPQAELEKEIENGIAVTPQELAQKGSLLRVLANRCSLCRQLIGDSAKMKIHWQRTHAPEWKRVSSSSIAGSRSLSAVFSSPCSFCGSQARNTKDHSGKCAALFQLLATRELRQHGGVEPAPSRGPSEKQLKNAPQYASFKVEATPIGQFFKPKASCGVAGKVVQFKSGDGRGDGAAVSRSAPRLGAAAPVVALSEQWLIPGMFLAIRTITAT